MERGRRKEGGREGEVECDVDGEEEKTEDRIEGNIRLRDKSPKATRHVS